MEGSFGTGRQNTELFRKVSLHDSSPLQDETLVEVAEAAQAVNKGGTVRNRPLLMNVSKGRFCLCCGGKKNGGAYEQRTGKNL